MTSDIIRKTRGDLMRQNTDGDPYSDPSKVYPKREYVNAPTTNLEARGIEQNELYIGGGDIDLDLDLREYPSSQYPLNQVRRSVSGHVTEIDDTPGRERMLFKHKTGAGVEMRADGTVIVNAINNQIQVTGGDQKVIIEGNGQMVYHGNLKMRVDGDFDLDVGGNMNVNIGGDHIEDVKGGYRQDVNKNHQTFVNRNQSNTITGSQTNFTYGDQNNIVKGSLVTAVEQNNQLTVGTEYQISAEKKFITTSPDINIGASSLTVIGDSGTMGGEEMVYYGHTAHIPRVNSTSVHATAMYATTFHGDLTGKADDANQADFATTAGQAPLGSAGSPGSNTNDTTTAANKTTVQPTNAIMKNDWFNSEYGIFRVAVDVGNVVFNTFNRLFDYNDVSDRTLTTTEIRSKLRDPANQTNTKFIGECIAEGSLSTSFGNATPSNTGDIVANDASPRFANPNEIFGRVKGAEAKRYSGSVQNKQINIIPDPEFDPMNKAKITKDTKLANGITIAKFLGGYGDSVTIDHKTTAEKLTMAKNLYLHANLMKSVIQDRGEFDEFRLVIAEGIYKKGEKETVTAGSINDLAQSGRAVVYELRDRNGKIANKQTFRLAAWWKDSQQYEKMILDYDTYNPDGSLNVQIIVIMPELTGEYYTAKFNNNLETRFNNYVQSTNELVEIL